MNKDYLIKNVDIYCSNGIIVNGFILVENGIIKDISPFKIESEFQVIDGLGKLLLPGFIDIHVNGGGGGMSIDGSVESIQKIIRAHAKFGTTSMLVTTISVEDNLLMDSISAIVETAENGNEFGSKILGIHLEGPFLSANKRGAHQKQYLKKPNKLLFEQMYNVSKGKIKVLSLAPELEGAMELIKYVRKKEVIVGLAHSEADYEITKESIKAGLSLCTHLFNGMIPFTHKEAGPVGAFLTTENTFIEVITDAVHITPSVLQLVYQAKKSNEIIIVTDAVTPAGSDIKNFTILGVDLEVRNNSCFIPNTSNLAGSSLTMNIAVKTFVNSTECSLLEAVNMASLNPATLLKIENTKGSIDVGKDADLILVDHDLNVYLTMIEGRIVYKQ